MGKHSAGVIILWNGTEYSVTLFSGTERFVKQLFQVLVNNFFLFINIAPNLTSIQVRISIDIKCTIVEPM